MEKLMSKTVKQKPFFYFNNMSFSLCSYLLKKLNMQQVTYDNYMFPESCDNYMSTETYVNDIKLESYHNHIKLSSYDFHIKPDSYDNQIMLD